MKRDLPPIPYNMTAKDKTDAATYAVYLEEKRRAQNERDEQRRRFLATGELPRPVVPFRLPKDFRP